MTSKITTYCGAAVAMAGAVMALDFSPLCNKICLGVLSAANAAGLFFARDNRVSDEKAGAKSTP